MPKPSEIFDTPAATGFSRVGGNEEIINEFNRFIEKWCGNNFPHLIDSDGNDGERFRNLIRSTLTTKDQEKEEAIRAEREKIVEIIKDELRNAPLEVQMTKGIIFANVVYRIGALPTEDNK